MLKKETKWLAEQKGSNARKGSRYQSQMTGKKMWRIRNEEKLEEMKENKIVGSSRKQTRQRKAQDEVDDRGKKRSERNQLTRKTKRKPLTEAGMKKKMDRLEARHCLISSVVRRTDRLQLAPSRLHKSVGAQP